MSELRITDTNSANDNKGRALGLEGNDFLFVIGGIVGAFAVYLLLNTVLHLGMTVALVFAVPVLVGPIAWALLLRHNRPDGFAEDFFDQLFNGEGWSFAPRAQPRRLGSSSDEQERA